MPELPEVETVRRGLAPALTGATITRVLQRRPDLRFPLPPDMPERLEGASVLAVKRRAKYLVLPLSTGESLIAHLGMTGRFTVTADGEVRAPGAFDHAVNPQKHEHIVLEAEGGSLGPVRIGFADPRRFGYWDLLFTDDLSGSRHFAGMGPEPLSDEWTGTALTEALAGKRTPIKAALLDQRVVAGLGNIYVCEALHRAGISPRREARTIGAKRAGRLVPEVKAVLQEAIEAGGSTLRDYRSAEGGTGYFQHRFSAYGREGEPCTRCGGVIARIVQSGRSTFYCGGCQR
ncbi:bifunctional DNA-formamidopyrimidine glycosylase/DNA-(apurinic or apyrimidinic site) lyase [Parvularcula dongshanensis]|uniref:Formamidopyrimidine-DNA glycosylase n=1 Tax=Parvularcula dongshanensis TaxID=1173995 RepID=A0A840I0G9_9PROT|nr:bifunctional DNA-formamidopyrimidine glycosylase/DNA-(apurinic or apyrimidinic site) lyase [Parvularcula dongshanensis]MBB4657781.1 formamidopyrimidine-DNA glycosylase [Parvularcula dongshanensis]